MITDKLASYGAAKREVMPSVEHRKHKDLNNRAENSHQPTRRREQLEQYSRQSGPSIALAKQFEPRDERSRNLGDDD